jgi:hypothetical protein
MAANEPDYPIPLMFSYNGQNRIRMPRDVTRVEVHPGMKVIGTWALSEFQRLVHVELPEGLQVIGRSAFNNCSSLEHVRLPSSVNELRSGAFAHCSALKAIELNQGLQMIMDGAFQHCESLRKVKIPSSVRTVGNVVFYRCSKLVSVDLPEGIQVVGRNAFMRCESLVRVSIPSSVTYIGAFAFKGCTSLVSVELPERLQTIRDEAFIDCASLKNVLFIPPTITDLAEYVFDYDSLLLDESFPDLKDLIIEVDDCTTSITSRFDGLPMHKLCYFQAHPPVNESGGLLDEIRKIMDKSDRKIFKNKKRQDYLGMTPLHILALSSKPNMALWEALFDAYPKDLETKDRWGNCPYDYLIDNEDSGSLAILKHALKARSTSLLNSLGLEKWKVDICNAIDDVSDHSERRYSEIDLVYSMFAKYQRLEILGLLELAIWKAKMEENALCTTKDAVLGPLGRMKCRINCGAEIVISNITPFLGNVELCWW